MKRKLNLTTVLLVALAVAMLVARVKGIPVPIHDFRVGFSSGG